MSVEQLIVLVGLAILTIGRAIKQHLEQRAQGDAERPGTTLDSNRAGGAGPLPDRFAPPRLDSERNRNEPVPLPAPLPVPLPAPVRAPPRLRAQRQPASDVPRVPVPRAASSARRMLRRDLSNPKRAIVLIAVFGPPRADTLAAPRTDEPRPPRAR
jgi:hypothetical protein